TLGHARQAYLGPATLARGTAVVVVPLDVASLLVRGEEAAEGDLRARGGEHGLDGPVDDGVLPDDGVEPTLRTGLRRDAHGRGRAARVGHLRGDGALPDEVVELELVARELARDLLGGAEGVARGADRLVRLLRALGLRGVDARLLGDRLGTVRLGGLAARRADRLLAQRGRVGAHVGDVAVLVQRLRGAHRLPRAHAQLARGLLLEGRGRERGRGAARVRLGL